MKQKPEAKFRNSVHTHFPSKTKVRRQAGGSSYAAGTPDQRYAGKLGVMWVEWKYFQVIPPTWNMATPTMKSHKVRLSPLQLDWLEDEYALSNGTKLGVAVGCSDGGILLTHGAWRDTFTRDEFLSRLLTRKQLAAAILEHVHA